MISSVSGNTRSILKLLEEENEERRQRNVQKVFEHQVNLIANESNHSQFQGFFIDASH